MSWKIVTLLAICDHWKGLAMYYIIDDRTRIERTATTNGRYANTEFFKQVGICNDVNPGKLNTKAHIEFERKFRRESDQI